MRPDRLSALLGPLLAGGAAALVVSGDFRGLNLWALWQLESVERFAAWRDAPGADTLMTAFADDHGLLPLVGWLVSLFFESADALVGLRFAAALAAAVVVWTTWSWGRQAGGVIAGVAAAAALLLTPRFLAAATVPGPTIFALATLVFAALACVRSRASVLWAPVAWFAVTAAMLTSLVGWLLLLPVAYLTLVEARAPARRGMVVIRPVAWWMLLLPPVATLLVIAAVPYFQHDTGDRMGELLGFWMTRPAEPYLYDGKLFGPDRIPLRLPIVIWALTFPPAIGVLAAAALVRTAPIFRPIVGRLAPPVADPREGLRAAWVFLAAAAFLPVGLRSPFHGGIDLLALGLPLIAVFFGWGFARAVAAVRAWSPDRSAGRNAALVAVGVLVAWVAATDVGRVGGHFEAYYNGLVGGPGGAARAGLSRYAHGPAPPEVFAQIGRPGQTTRLAILSNRWELAPIVERYERIGLITGPIELSEPAVADVVCLVFDDALPELYPNVRDFLAFTRPGDDHGVWSIADGVPLVGAGRRSN